MTNWLITGIGSGLGRALARAALRRGDTVFGTSRRDHDPEFEAMAPGRAHLVPVDLGDREAVRAAVARAEQLAGGIDRLVNNAGYGLAGAVEEVSIEEMIDLFQVNLFGAVRMIQAVLPGMRGRGRGHIVNITSVSGLAPWAGTGAYGASKYALECIGQTLAREVAPFGIRVTNVAPGGLRTGFAASLHVAARDIADYEAVAHQARHQLRAHAGREQGDPDRAAEAVIMALDAPEPPLHLLLGEDALHYAHDQFSFVAAQIDQWRPLSLSIAFPEGAG